MATPNQSYTWNAYESNLSGPLLAGLTTVALDFIPNGLGVPAYLVIDPDVPASREYIKVLSYTGNTIDSMLRNLTGSAGDVDHAVGAVIRAVYTMQMLDDTFLDIETNIASLTSHENDSGDPHAAAGYLKSVTAIATYLPLAGGVMTGILDMGNNRINAVGDATAATNAMNRQASDARYLRLSGGTMTGTITAVGEGSTGIVFAWTGGTGINLSSFTNGDMEVRRGITSLMRFNNSAAKVEIIQQLDMGGSEIRNVGDPANSGAAMSRAFADARYLQLIGGSGNAMHGNLNAGGFRVTSVADATTSTDALTQQSADTRYLQLIGGTMSGQLNMNGNEIRSVGDPANAGAAMSRGYADARYVLQ